MLSKYETDDQLLEKVRTGVGDPAIFNDNQNFLDIGSMFAGIEPVDFYQQLYWNPSKEWSPVGSNDLEKAKAVQYSYYIAQSRNPKIDQNAYMGFEEHLHEAVAEWASKTNAATFNMFT